MKALLSINPGPPSTLAVCEVVDPAPGQHEVRIAVEACGVNYPDVLIVQDLYQFRPERPFAPGAEVAGRIDAVGAGVTRFAVGDRVVGGAGWGGMVEKMLVPETRCSTKPGRRPLVSERFPLERGGEAIERLAARASVGKVVVTVP